MKNFYATMALIGLSLFVRVSANEVIELDTTFIKGNTELPKYLYVVPWADKKGKRDKQRKLRLHNLYGDLFDPVMPENNLVEEVQVPDLLE